MAGAAKRAQKSSRAAKSSKGEAKKARAKKRPAKPAKARSAKPKSAKARKADESERARGPQAERFVRELLVRGEAARRDRRGKLPPEATHVIEECDKAGRVKVARVRFKLA